MKVSGNNLLQPRYKTARARLPGDLLFWQTMLAQNEYFAAKTASAIHPDTPKGGPFGAQLWLVNPKTNEYVMVGTPGNWEDSNAVVSKGIASAHAEAENLSTEKRQAVMDFLRENRGKGWQVVQVSTGESCQSCRTKQVGFAQELIHEGLIKPGQFHVAFKSPYEQTFAVADFKDLQYDNTFRLVERFGLADNKNWLFDLESQLNKNPISREMIQRGQLVYTPVITASKSWGLEKLAQPAAVVVSKGRIIGEGRDTRSESDINMPEKTAIVSALHDAATKKRARGVFEAWNLDGATLVTNEQEIGPYGYGESLWYNLSGIEVVTGPHATNIDIRAREVPSLTNRNLFRLAAGDYNVSDSPLRVAFLGNYTCDKSYRSGVGRLGDASPAQLMWRAQTMLCDMLGEQAGRVEKLVKSGVKILTLDGKPVDLKSIIQTSTQNAHYDGAQGNAPAAAVG